MQINRIYFMELPLFWSPIFSFIHPFFLISRWFQNLVDQPVKNKAIIHLSNVVNVLSSLHTLLTEFIGTKANGKISLLLISCLLRGGCIYNL